MGPPLDSWQPRRLGGQEGLFIYYGCPKNQHNEIKINMDFEASKVKGENRWN